MFRRMSRWDPEPTNLQRWIVRNRRWIRALPVFTLIAAVFSAVGLIVTKGLDPLIFGGVFGVWASVTTLQRLSELSAFVKSYDAKAAREPDMD